MSNQISQTTNPTLLASVALTSFAALLLELALTRLFSVVLFYHFAFLAISIALLGLGAGGVFAYIARQWLRQFETRHLAAQLCTMNAAAIVFTLIVVLRVPVSLELSSWNFLRLTALYLAAAIPFFFTGLLFSVVFARESRHITRLYGADLVGGAAACLAIVPLLNIIGGPNTVLFAAFVSGLTAILWKRRLIRASFQFFVPGILLLLIAFNYSGRLIDIVYAKGLARNRDWVEFAKWNAISRVEVDRQGGAKAIVIDADASTYIMNVANSPSSVPAAVLMFSVPSPMAVRVSPALKSIQSSPPPSCVDATPTTRTVSTNSPKFTFTSPTVGPSSAMPPSNSTSFK
jgi:hypothetical protein